MTKGIIMLTLYTFERPGGEEFTYTTTDPTEAERFGRARNARVIENRYEFNDSEMVWDFTDETED